MLAAQPETKLNDKGNKYRPDGLTQSKSFNRYIELSRRFKRDQKAWQDIVGSKLNLPVCNYDEERIVETSEGWTLSFMPEMLTAPDRTSDFMRYDLSSLDPSKDFVGLIEENGITSLVMADNAPLRIDRLTGSRPEYRRYAQALIYKALMDVMPSRAEVVIDSCQQMGKDTAIWRIGFHLGRGGTVADVRRKSATSAPPSVPNECIGIGSRLTVRPSGCAPTRIWAPTRTAWPIGRFARHRRSLSNSPCPTLGVLPEFRTVPARRRPSNHWACFRTTRRFCSPNSRFRADWIWTSRNTISASSSPKRIIRTSNHPSLRHGFLHGVGEEESFPDKRHGGLGDGEEVRPSQVPDWRGRFGQSRVLGYEDHATSAHQR